MKKTRFNLIIIGILTIAIVVYILKTNDIAQLKDVLKNARISWLLAAGFCLLAYWFSESGVLYYTANSAKHKLTFKKAIQTTMIGQLFNNLTPFASGGQPVQAYFLTKNKFQVGEASSILLMKFIVYQCALILYSGVLLLVKFTFFMHHVTGLSYLVFLGFGVNFLVVACLICIGFFPFFTEKVAAGLIKILAKLKIIKNKDKAIKKANIQIMEFYHGFRNLLQNKSVLIRTTIITLIQLTAFFIIPFCICMSLQAISYSALTVVAAGAFVLMISSFVPLPGASGGAEVSFYLFFGIFLAQYSVLAVAIILWRILTFYIPIIAGMLFCKFDHISPVSGDF